MFGLGMQEVVIIGIVAILLFGKRLPEVAKSLGKSYRQFRQGLHDIQSSIDMSESYDARPAHTSYAPTPSVADDYDEYDDATAPKFEPPPSEPLSSKPLSSEPLSSEPLSSEPTQNESAEQTGS